MSTWRWVDATVVYAIHDRQIAEHGGLEGVRDHGAIESALAKPQNLAAYGNPSPTELAAAYAYGIARSHGFADGNKRTAWIAARLFLADNGCRLQFSAFDAINTTVAVASGTISEAELAAWFQRHLVTG